jgi:O-antigen/teichoic acid export membrane protein
LVKRRFCWAFEEPVASLGGLRVRRIRVPTALDWITLLLPLVLAVHNLDEYAKYEDFVNAYHPRLSKKLTARPVIRNAVVLLTVSVALLAGFSYVYNDDVLRTICKVAIFALMLNAISHCVLSLKRGRILPGTLSAALLVLPYSVVAVMITHSESGNSYSDLALLAALGALTVPLAIALFIGLGYGISRWDTRRQA